MHPSAAPVPVTHALRPPHDWGAVLAPTLPEPTYVSVSGLGTYSDLVSLPIGVGEGVKHTVLLRTELFLTESQ